MKFSLGNRKALIIKAAVRIGNPSGQICSGQSIFIDFKITVIIVSPDYVVS